MIPSWVSLRAGDYEKIINVRRALSRHGIYTVCEGAKCPNIFHCWGEGTATFMILGEVCTRACRFCAVRTGNPRGYVDWGEVDRLVEAVRELGLKYVVVTSVARDDLPDGGASVFAAVVKKLREVGCVVEVLVPDFGGSPASVKTVVSSGPDVFAHNVETVRRLTPLVRDRRAGYERSLSVLKYAKEFGAPLTKSGLMLGLGETFEEVVETLEDLRRADVDIVTIGQYIKPSGSPRHLNPVRYATPEEFAKIKEVAVSLGFKAVASGPLVRSSYKAYSLYREALKNIVYLG
ncbi:lipoic acid synthetase [Pyrobaculum aerophilum str. IM2]|uniref:Lipoyl synthase n=2 Tax=Pyrobaculum aerophilum TaxID=13773 RepID=LIPA_PYRAE|nr:lipoyl synthase [Pyrobaculum aerophilum]Q8ZUR9.1 RecName: Full=Lipoyl synthase; AltName: Full=Lip-syn; Short=LS; AltName: Full=Lipoate synthase; AltName: Full=Lipoic acid synthase; AltName: Full=Sulfur insertion protein LipA [Pyrobaculum aerophilum str. IM2]AAL64337.1 lipoic acid synthetase [Pyrobaculum aerophilum str. IM2]